jgi:methionyl-tRNA formyltransferase
MMAAPRTLRIAFMGTPDFAVPVLNALINAGHTIVAVYSQPPSHAGRGKKLKNSPVHEIALSSNIEVRTPSSLKTQDEQSAFRALDLDVAVVVAYGQILPKEILVLTSMRAYFPVGAEQRQFTALLWQVMTRLAFVS